MIGNLNSKHTTWKSTTDNIAGNILANHLSKLSNVMVAAPTPQTHYLYRHNHRPNILNIDILKSGNLKFTLENLLFELFISFTNSYKPAST